MLAASRLYTVSNRAIAEYGVPDGMRIWKGTELLGRKLLQRHFVHHKSHTTCVGTKVRISKSTMSI
jgi:hypothetical protein